jgi:hypothetical protein
MDRQLLALIAFFLCFSAEDGITQQPEDQPSIKGFVTRGTSLTDFDINGLRVVYGKEIRFGVEGVIYVGEPAVAPPPPYIGEPVTVSGDINKSKRQITAALINFTPLPASAVSGKAIVDRVLPAGNSQKMVVRADGYPIQITATTKVTFQTPLTSLSDVTTNVWITYHGDLLPEGIVIAKTADFARNEVKKSETSLLDKNDYDPKAVDTDSKQSGTSKFFRGTDPKQIPPYKDPAMQAHIDRIGNSLVPAYQQALPTTDLTKLAFRFQLIDQPKLKNAMALPTGIILVPRQVIERLQNDSQIATVLADNIAWALEKEDFYYQPKANAIGAAGLAGDVGGLFVPGLGLVAIPLAMKDHSLKMQEMLQSGRVSLALLHDAGYDVQEAPVAWWRLSAKSPKDLDKTLPPDRSINLYRFVGSTWRTDSNISAAQAQPESVKEH